MTLSLMRCIAEDQVHEDSSFPILLHRPDWGVDIFCEENKELCVLSVHLLHPQLLGQKDKVIWESALKSNLNWVLFSQAHLSYCAPHGSLSFVLYFLTESLPPPSIFLENLENTVEQLNHFVVYVFGKIGDMSYVES